MPSHEQTTVVLGHLTGRSPAWGLTWWGEERRYRTSAHPYRRPETGDHIVELRCPACDAELLLRVRSLALSRLIRKRFLIAAAIGLVLVAVTVAIGLGSEYAGTPIPLPSPLGTSLLVAFLAGAAAAGIGLYGWRNESALRLYTETVKGDEHHRLLSGAEPHDASAP
ncbi:hypothetical protein [Glycomyces sp. NPDC048151]|uniref:hypothetical protein n=1 Tax=Glycomyces sp. NPDC048151 TaxID=3364002 RepID=UPI00371C9E38